MLGICRSVVILHVAAAAGNAGQVVIPVDVTLRARQGRMSARQRKSNRVVVKSCRGPTICGVAGLAGLRKVECDVVGVLSLLIVGQMAPYTIGWSPLELVANVAGSALQRGMHASECEPGVLQMIKVHPEPTVEVVALITSRRETCAGVNRSGGRLEVNCMAGIALRRKTLKLTHRRAFVAGITIHSGMRPEQGEAIHVLLDLL